VIKLDLAPWDLNTHWEPLLMFLCLPYRSQDPKLEQGRRLLEAFSRDLQAGFLTSTDQRSRGNLLPNFCWKRGPFAPCEGCWCPDCFRSEGHTEWFIRSDMDKDGKVLITKGSERRFLVGRQGEHLITPFQCHLCHFQNVQQRDPLDFLPTDQQALEFITRAVLDSFWSREPSTV